VIVWLLWRNLRSRGGANALTALTVAFAVAISLTVPLVMTGLRQGSEQAAQIFNLLITAKGSPTQAVLNTIFLQEAPIGNIPYELFLKLKGDNRTSSAIPLGFGDNYNGFPLVGTTLEFFELREKRSDPAFYRLESGRFFDEERVFEAVLGAQAARISGLSVGDHFQSAHGMVPTLEEDPHSNEYQVVGVLAASGGPGDRGVYVPLAALWQEHAVVGNPAPKEVTAILYTPTKLGYAYQLATELDNNRYMPGIQAQGVFPGAVLGRLLDLLGQSREGYVVLGGLVLVLSLATVAINTFAAAVAGGRNLAVLRLMGASSRLVFILTLLEALVVTCIGVIVGLVLSIVGAGVAGVVVSERVGFVLPFIWPQWSELLTPLWLVPVAVGFAVAPAVVASRQSPLDGVR
jgi:putative ABC transport system permease protein